MVLRQLPLPEPQGRRRRRSTPASSCARSTTRSTRASPRAAGRSTNADLISVTYLSDPTDDHRPPPARHHQRARPRPRTGRPPLQRQLHPRLGRHAARGRRQQAQRRGHRPLGDPRVAQRRAVPDRRRARADRRAARRLRPRPDRPARQQGDPRHRCSAPGSNHTFKGGARMEPLRQLPRHGLCRRRRLHDAAPTSTAAPASPPAQVAAGGWTGLQFDVSTTSDFNGLIRTIDAQRRSRARSTTPTTSTATARSRRPSSAPACVFSNANPTARRALRPRLPGRDRPAGDLLEGPDASSCRTKCSSATADAEPRRPHRAVGALRDDRREHLHVPVGVRAAPERRLRHPRRRPAQGVRVLGPLLRPDPQQHDQLRGHADRLDHRGAGVRARRTSSSPTARAAARRCRTRSSRRPRRRPTPTICRSATASTSATT